MEIRDTRNGEWHWVNNAVIACPHITAFDKVVYSALCTFAGCKEIRPDFELIAERASVSVRQAKKSITCLIKAGYVIKVVGGGRGRANVYQLLKVPKGCRICTVSKPCTIEQETVHNTTVNGAHCAPQIDKELDKNKIIAEQAPLPFILEDKLLNMEKNTGGFLDIIATFIREKKLCPENSKQLSNIIGRYSIVAKKLEGAYTDQQIFKAIEEVKKDSNSFSRRGEELDWTLDTVYKKLTK